MEPPAAAHIYRRGLRFDPHQCSAARSEQPGIFHLVGREQDSRLRDRAEGLYQRPLAVLARLRLHRCASVERHLADHPQGQPHSARAVPSILVVEQVSDRSGLVGLARRRLFSDSYASSDDTVYLPGFLRFDAGVYAQIDATWKALLTIENIFNKGYWATADGNNNISPGQPRTFRFKVTANL